MESVKRNCSQLNPPNEFPFPFKPYDIQKEFMKKLYETLEGSNIGIFESPTGTGKSLSLICGALKWLVDSEQRDKERLEDVLAGRLPPSVLESQSGATVTTSNATSKDTKEEPDWFAEFDQQKAEKEALYRLREELELKNKREEKLRRLKEEHGTAAGARWREKRKRDVSPTRAEIDKLLAEASGELTQEDEVDRDIVVAEYFSDDDTTTATNESSETEDSLEEEHVRKIYYCSRTHTQLAQFVREVQKSPFGDFIHVVTLGSRQNLCINEEVTRLKSLTLINDRCLEMQKNKTKNDKKDSAPAKEKKRKTTATTTTAVKSSSTCCPFYKPDPLESFRDLALAEVQDIEQLVTVGRELGACPYYGVRYAIPAAQLVVLPYNTLLHTPTREAVGVRLKNNVVIIDEAHNLLDTISNVYSIEISGSHITKAHSQLSQYLDRYRSRLKAKNLMYINQLLHILSYFIKALENDKSSLRQSTQDTTDTKLHRLNDFLFSSKLDNVNLFKVLRYCQRSQISKKLNGFVDRYCEPPPLQSVAATSRKDAGGSKLKKKLSSVGVVPRATSDLPPPSSVGKNDGGHGGGGEQHQMNSPLMLIETFLQALTNTDKDGRIVITKKATLMGSSLKFLLLNPSVHFTSIVQEARAVVVAGGTMQPVSEFKDQLLSSAGVSPERVIEFSCGHVIPPDHLLPLCLCKGPGGTPFEFNYQTRDKHSLIDELGRTLLNLSTMVPGGVVCFFPSYDYERKVHAHWEKSGVLEKIGKKKKVFREPKLASQVDLVLSQYSRCIKMAMESPKKMSDGLSGAVMLCVVGGKLSEGINFSDDLGRCIVMVGLPYPNIKSPELNEKIQYLNANMPRYSDGRLPGQVHYENLCMKAVNQSIGRSIRHARDYACIVLVDQRYERRGIRGKLPEWINSQLQVCHGFGQAFAAVRKFFVRMK